MKTRSDLVEDSPDYRPIEKLLERYHPLLGRTRLFGLLGAVALLALLVVLMGSNSHWMHKAIWTLTAALAVIVRVVRDYRVSRTQSQIRFDRTFASARWTDRQLRRSGREENLWAKSSLYQFLRRRQMAIPDPVHARRRTPVLRGLMIGGVDALAVLVVLALVAHVAVGKLLGAPLDVSGVGFTGIVAATAFVVCEIGFVTMLRRCRTQYRAIVVEWTSFCSALREQPRLYRHTEKYRQVTWTAPKQKGASSE